MTSCLVSRLKVMRCNIVAGFFWGGSAKIVLLFIDTFYIIVLCTTNILIKLFSCSADQNDMCYFVGHLLIIASRLNVLCLTSSDRHFVLVKNGSIADVLVLLIRYLVT